MNIKKKKIIKNTKLFFSDEQKSSQVSRKFGE